MCACCGVVNILFTSGHFHEIFSFFLKRIKQIQIQLLRFYPITLLLSHFILEFILSQSTVNNLRLAPPLKFFLSRSFPSFLLSNPRVRPRVCSVSIPPLSSGLFHLNPSPKFQFVQSLPLVLFVSPFLEMWVPLISAPFSSFCNLFPPSYLSYNELSPCPVISYGS